MAAKIVPSPYSLTVTLLICLHCERIDVSPMFIDDHEFLNVPTEVMAENHAAVQLFLQRLLDDRNLTEAMLASKDVTSIVVALRDCTVTRTASRLLKWLLVASLSIDALIDFVTYTRNATQTGAIDPASLTGSFVRDVILGFEQLSFESTAHLWTCFRSQVQAAEAALPDANARVQPSTMTSAWTQPSDQIENGLRHLLQHEGSIDGLVASIFTDGLNPIHSSPNHFRDGDLPSLHLLKFLNSSRRGERVESVDELHSYFDRALIRSTESESTIGESRHILQYAPILLSALYCQNGINDISMLATEEAARVAQHSQDTASVAFALGWLFENAISNGNLGDMNILNRCAHRASSEGRQHNLLTGAEFLLARQSLMTTRKDQGSASRAWGHLFNATSELPSTEASSLHDRPTRTNHIANAQVCLNAIARQRIVASSIWESFGQSSAAALSSLLCLECHPKISSDDARSAIQNVTRQCLYGSFALLERKEKDSYKNPIDTSRSDPSCVYGQCIRNLVKLGERFGLSLKEDLGREIHLVLHEWAVRRCDFGDADGIMMLLLSNLRPYENLSMQSLRQIKMQEALMYSRNDNMRKAREILNNLLLFCKKGGMGADEGQILLQRAVQILHSTHEYAVNALGPIIECLSLCEKLQLGGLKGPALSILAEFCSTTEPELSISVLRVALPILLKNGHVWFQGQAFLTLAKCHLRLAKSSLNPEGPSANRKIRAALKYLNRAEDVLSRCQDTKGLREIYYLQARLFASASVYDESARKTAADNFVAISRHISRGTARLDAIRGTQGKQQYLELSGRMFPIRT